LVPVPVDELGSVATGGTGSKRPRARRDGDRDVEISADSVFILVGSEGVREKAEDDLSELGAMQAQKAHAAPFKDEIEAMFEALSAIGSVVEVWIRVQ